MIKKNVKLSPERESWNKRIEEEYKKNKKMKKMVKINEQQTVSVQIDNVKTDNNVILINNQIDKTNSINEYKQLQKEYIKTDDNETIKKWKILSKAYKIGKEIYGQNFSILKLSQHFDIPYTTTKRVLSLDKANEKTWELIKEEKISAFKVAQICMSKNVKYQDQIVEMVIKDNFSTTDIKKIKMTTNGLDVKNARLKKAIEEGYSRKSSAFKAIKDTSNRMIKLLDIEVTQLPEKRVAETIDLLEMLQNKINRTILKLSV